MNDEPIKLQGQENGADPETLPLHRYHVAAVMMRLKKGGEDGNDSVDIRLQGIKNLQATDEKAAEWLATGLLKKDDQIPEGFILNSLIAMEIE